jgi:hypothetical protein
MASIVVYDANVLFPAPLRDLLTRVAMSGAVRARWTDDILDDFPSHVLQPLGVEALHPDAFFSELIEHDAEAVCSAVTRQARALQNPPQTRAELLDTLEAQRLSRAVAALRELLDTPSSED